MNADQHLITITGEYTASLQMQLALARAERDEALTKITELQKTLESKKES